MDKCTLKLLSCGTERNAGQIEQEEQKKVRYKTAKPTNVWKGIRVNNAAFYFSLSYASVAY